MASLLSDYEYDIFISYRQNDNKSDGWVTKFVEKLQEELEATIKVAISVYFDENPHDGLLETHIVEESLSRKLKSLIFIPIVSQTYCDPNSFAWQQEFLPFIEMAENDDLGKFITLANGNVASRILPVRIHKLDEEDQCLLEKELGGPIRAVDFVHEAPGINRPLDSIRDDTYSGENKVIYRDQINKVANSIKEILVGIKKNQELDKDEKIKEAKEINQDISSIESEKFSFQLWGKSFLRRNVPQVIITITLLYIILYRALASIVTFFEWPSWVIMSGIVFLGVLAIIAIILAWMYEFGPEGLIRTRTWESRLNPYPGYKRKPLTGIVTISALVLILIFQSFYADIFFAKAIDEKHYIRNKAIAVLPFKNQSDIDKEDYFTEDLTDDITVQLSKIKNLRVLGWAATANYVGDSINFQKIGNDLNVSVVLIGSVRKFGDQLRIICQLLDIKTNHVIWADIYNRETHEVFKIQGLIVQEIAEVMGSDLTQEERVSLEQEPSQNMTAIKQYLKGREFYYQYEKEANNLAIQAFKSAIKLDSSYALAWAGLGDAFSLKNSMFGDGINWNDSCIKAASKAVKLDPASEETFKALGNAYYYKMQIGRALENYLKAVEINPNYSPAIGNIGSIYHIQGKFDEAIKWQIKSAELNPKNFIPYYMAGWSYRSLGDFHNAEKWLKKSLEISVVADTYRELGYTYVQLGIHKNAIDLIPKVLAINSNSSKSYEEAGLIALFANELDSARVCFNKAIELNSDLKSDPNSIAPLAEVYFSIKSGENEKSLTELQRLESMYLDIINNGSEDDDHRIYLAGIKMMQGKDKEALQWIKRAIESNWHDLAEIEHIPWFEPLRTNPEYLQTIAPLQNKIKEMRKKVDELN